MSKKEQPHRPRTFLPLLGAVSALAFLFLARSASLQGQLIPSFCEAFPRFCLNVQIDEPETFNSYTSPASFSSSSAMAALLPGGGTAPKTICDFLPEVCQPSSAASQSSARVQSSNMSAQSSLRRCAPFQVTCQPFSTFECPCLNSHFTIVCPDTGCGMCPICDPPPPPFSSTQTAFSIASIPIASSQSSSIYNGQPTDVSLTMRLIDPTLIHKNGSAHIRVSVQNTGTVEATNVRVTGSIPGILGNPTSLQPNHSETTGCSFQGMNYECSFATLQAGQTSEAILAIAIPLEYQTGRCPGLGTILGQARTDIPELTQVNNMVGVTMAVQCGTPASFSSSRISSSSQTSVGGSTADIFPVFRNGVPTLRLGVNRLLLRVENTGNLRADFNRLFVAIPQYGQFNAEYSSYFCYSASVGVTCEVPSIRPGESVDVDVGFTVAAAVCPQSVSVIARATTQTVQSNTDNDALIMPLPIDCSGRQHSSFGQSSVGQRSSFTMVSSALNQSSVIAGTVDLAVEEGVNFPVNTLKGAAVVLPYRIGNLGTGTVENVRAFVPATPAAFNGMLSSPLCFPIGSAPNPQFGIGQRIECIIPRIQPGQWVDISLAYDIPENFPRCPGVIVHPFSIQRRPGELNGQNNDVSSRVLALCEPNSSNRPLQSSQASSVSRAPTNGIDLSVQSLTAIGPQPGILNYSQPIDYRYYVTVQNIGNAGTDSFLLRTTVADSGIRFLTDELTDICNVRLETGVISGKSYIDCETTGFGNGGIYPGRSISLTIKMRVPSTYASGQGCRQLYPLTTHVYEPNGRDVSPSNNEQVYRANIRCSDGTTTSAAPLEYRAEYGQGMQLLVRRNSPISMMANGRARFLYAVRNNSSVDTSYSYAIFRPSSRFSFDPAISSSGCSLQPDGSIRCALPGLQRGEVAVLDLGLSYAGNDGCGASLPLQAEVDGAAVGTPIGAFRLNRTTVDSIRVDCGNQPSSAARSSVQTAALAINERTNNFPTRINRGQYLRLPLSVQNLLNEQLAAVRVRVRIPSDNFSINYSSNYCSYNHALNEVVCNLPNLSARQSYPVDIGVYAQTYAECNAILSPTIIVEGTKSSGEKMSATIAREISLSCSSATSQPRSSQPRSSVGWSSSISSYRYACPNSLASPNYYCTARTECGEPLASAFCGESLSCCTDINIVKDRTVPKPDIVLMSTTQERLGTGDVAMYRLSILNRGAVDTSEATLHIPIPPGLYLESISDRVRGSCSVTNPSHPTCTIPPTPPGRYVQYDLRMRIPQNFRANECPNTSYDFIPYVVMQGDDGPVQKSSVEQTVLNNRLVLRTRVGCTTTQPQGVCCEAGSCNPFGTCSNPFSNYNACTAACGSQASSSAGTAGGNVTLSVTNGTPNATAGDNVSLFVRVGNAAGRNLQGAYFDVRFPSTLNSATTVIANGTCSVRTGNILHCQRSNTLTVGQAWVQRIDFRTNRLLPCSTTSNLSFATTVGATGVSTLQASTTVRLPCRSASSRVATPTSSRANSSAGGGGRDIRCNNNNCYYCWYYYDPGSGQERRLSPLIALSSPLRSSNLSDLCHSIYDGYVRYEDVPGTCGDGWLDNPREECDSGRRYQVNGYYYCSSCKMLYTPRDNPWGGSLLVGNTLSSNVPKIAVLFVALCSFAFVLIYQRRRRK